MGKSPYRGRTWKTPIIPCFAVWYFTIRYGHEDTEMAVCQKKSIYPPSFLSFLPPWSCHPHLISSSKGMTGSQIQPGRELGKLNFAKLYFLWRNTNTKTAHCIVCILQDLSSAVCWPLYLCKRCHPGPWMADSILHLTTHNQSIHLNERFSFPWQVLLAVYLYWACAVRRRWCCSEAVIEHYLLCECEFCKIQIHAA